MAQREWVSELFYLVLTQDRISLAKSENAKNFPIPTIKWLSVEKQNLNNFPFRIVDAFSQIFGVQKSNFTEFKCLDKAFEINVGMLVPRGFAKGKSV